MSTRSSIKHTDRFHLYHDFHEPGVVFLHLPGADFEATRHGVTVALPFAVWEAARRYACVDLGPAEMTEAEIRSRCEADVAERVAHERAGRSLSAMFGLLVYGPPTDPPGRQVEAGVQDWLGRREECRKLVGEIDRLVGGEP